jgi:hypothetical protein
MRSAAFGSVGVRPRQIADSTRPNSRNSRQAPPPVIADFCNKIGPFTTEAVKVLHSRASAVPRKRRSALKMRSAAWGNSDRTADKLGCR